MSIKEMFFILDSAPTPSPPPKKKEKKEKKTEKYIMNMKNKF